MPRFVKFTLITIVVIIIGLGVVGVLLSHFVNPNQFKDHLTTLINDKTGYQVTLGGNISWSLSPNLGVSIDNITAKARTDSPSHFATLKQATISLKLLPLLEKQIQIDAVSMDGLSVQLMVDQQGNGNWQANPGTTNKKTGALAPGVEVVNKLSNTEPKKTRSDIMIDIADITVKNADVVYENKSTQQSLHITNLSIESEHILSGNQFPIGIAFDAASKNLGINGHIDINSDVILNYQENIFNFTNLSAKSSLTGKTFGDKTVPLTLNGSITVDQSKQTLSLSKLAVAFSNIKTNATIEYSLRNDEYKGVLSVPAFDINAFRESMTSSDDQTTPSSPAMLAFDAKIMGSSQFVFLNNMQIILNDTPLTGRAGISSFTNNTLDITLNAAQIDVETFLTRLEKTPHFSGLLNFSTHLTAQYNDPKPLSTLKGSGQFEVLNGKLKGENLTQEICDKVALLNNAVSTQGRDADTVFDTLKGSFIINGGILRTDDIVATMKGATINSQGHSNLLEETFSFKAGVIITGDSEDVACSVNERYQNMALPIICEGNFDTEPGKLCSVSESGLADIAKKAVIQRASEKLEKKFGTNVDDIMDKLFGK